MDNGHATRVKQFDADVLDNELHNLLNVQLSKLLKYVEFHKGLVYKLRPEIETLIRLYVNYHSLFKNQSTVGQSLLELRLINGSNERLTNKQLSSYIFCTTLVPWITQRFLRLFGTRNEQLFERLVTFYKLLDLINLVVFLNKAQYSSLWKRMLQLDTVYCPQVTSPAVQYDCVNREVLWHGFAQFLTFILPFISFQRMKNTIVSLLSIYLRPKKPTIVQQRSNSDFTSCGICNQWPNNPFEIGCRHVYCYYCIMSNFMSDLRNGFDCPLCLYHVSNVENISQVFIQSME